MVNFGPFSARVADGWVDLTTILEQTDADPLTIGDPDCGVGLLQFSSAIYKSGPLPHVTKRILFKLLDDFARSRNLEMPFDRCGYPDCNGLVGQSFHSGEDFFRVWYVSNGKSFLLVTYVCEWSQKDTEAEQRETTVRSIRFNEPASNVVNDEE